MAISIMSISLNKSVEEVWKMITPFENNRWRSDLLDIDLMDKNHFIEYAIDGSSTSYVITRNQPNKCIEFDFENDSVIGHWIVVFRPEENATVVYVVAEVKSKKLFLRPFIQKNLRDFHNQYKEDLQKAVIN